MNLLSDNSLLYYTTGELWVLATGISGDYNNDGTIDAADYVVWRKGFTTGAYTRDDYNAWRTEFGVSFGPGSGSALPLPRTAVGRHAGAGIRGAIDFCSSESASAVFAELQSDCQELVSA